MTFGYTSTEPVLRDFDLTVAPGRDGRARRQLGFGQVDGRAAAPALLRRARGPHHDRRRRRARRPRSTRCARSIGVVFEDSFLFSDSITANIAFGRPTRPRDEIEAAARAAEAHEFILRLPARLRHRRRRAGAHARRAASASASRSRARCSSDPKILLLDDATSSVDSRIEEEIHATLRRIAQHAHHDPHRAPAVVAVARRPHRRGRPGPRSLDAGTHEELWARCTLYRMLLSGPGGDAEGDRGRSRRRSTTRTGRRHHALGVAGSRRRGDPQRADRRAHAHREPDRRGARRGRRRRRWWRHGCRRRVGRRARTDAGAARPGRRARARRPPTRTSTSRRRAEPAPDFKFLALPAALPRLAARRPVARRARRDVHARRARSSCGTASTDGVAATPQNPNAVWAASFVFLVITLFDWWVMWAEARVMGRIVGTHAARAARSRCSRTCSGSASTTTSTRWRAGS